MPEILMRMLQNGPNDDAAMATYILSELTPPDRVMPALGQEITDVFKICALTAEASFVADPRRRRYGELMMCCITKIHDVLTQRVQNGAGQHGAADARALLKHYQDTITTPLNLKMLFYMCDARTRTGEIRCRAFGLLMVISSSMLRLSPGVAPVWNMKIPIDDPFEPVVSFAIKAIAVLSKVLTQKGCCQYPQGQCPSQCLVAPWGMMANATGKVLKTEPLDGILLELYECTDWPTLLQDDDTYPKVLEYPGNITFFDVQTFINLHVWACEVLEKDPNNTTAKTFLREKLGSCHELLRKCLRRIITGKIHASSDERCLLDELDLFGHFLGKFMHCLDPAVPVDRETKALVRRARITMIETIVVKILMPNDYSLPVDAKKRMQIHSLDRYALCHLSRWQELHSVSESDSARWTRFKATMLDGPIMTSDESLVTRLRQEHEKAQSARTNNQNGQCANCFVSETAFRQECSESLMQCSRCRQVMYCSGECQREHWTGHKKQCKKVKNGKASKS